jgi:hypothetical protein
MSMRIRQRCKVYIRATWNKRDKRIIPCQVSLSLLQNATEHSKLHHVPTPFPLRAIVSIRGILSMHRYESYDADGGRSAMD